MHRVLGEHEVWLACTDDGALLGLMVLEGDWLDQLYVSSGCQGLSRT
jgi:hypothetical protein